MEGFELIATGLWSIVPPILALVLALITKEVYSSLTIGVFTGMIIYQFTLNGAGGEQLVASFTMVPQMMAEQIAGNGALLLFLALLGALTVVIATAGGSRAYAEWVTTHVKNARAASILTALLGIIIFVDDYFNCLTVGAVMRPVTDKFRVSHEKLAWIIDSTAAPVCIIAPVSSWAVAVGGYMGEDGFNTFVASIPYNFYALLTITMMINLALLDFDFGTMKIHEDNAKFCGDLFTTAARPYGEAMDDEQTHYKGKVIDLVLPVIVLIAACVCGMIYTGGFFHGEANFVDAFANSDASVGLVLGSFIALLFCFPFFLCRKVLNFKEFTDSIAEGFKAMVPAILILTFAWTLSGVTNALGSDDFVKSIVGNSHNSPLLPTILFLIGCGISFATGTSWGTFGILIPIVVNIFPDEISQMMCITIAACLGGAVMGDHCSPISDTTIMASTGGKSDHINHVSTQLPYACLVAAVCLVFYAIASVVQSVIVTPFAIAAMVGILFLMKKLQEKKAPSKSKKA